MRENDSMEVQKAKNYNSRLDKEILALRIRVKLLDSDRKKCTEQSEKSESEFSEKSPPDLEKEAQYNQLLHKRCQLVIEEKDCLNKELQFKLQKLQKELDEIVERNEELESILGDAQNKTKEKISCLECEIEGFQKIVINLETELSELRQFKDVPGIVQEEETHIKTAKDLRKISNLTQEKAAIDMTKEKGDICQQYQEKIKILEHEKETMRLALAEKAKQFEILQKKINEGMEEKQKLWEEIIQLQQDLSNTRQELQAKREENSRMKHDIMNRPERMPRPQICADGAEEMVPNLLAGEALIQQQYEEIRQLRQDLHRAQNLCSSAEKELRYERDKNLNVKKQHICLEQANTMVTAELHQVKQKLANVTAACSKLEVELEKKQQGVKEMELDILKQNQTFKLNSNYQEKLENEKCRATEAEKKVSELQQQLRASRHQLQLLETQVAERRNIEEELKKTRDNEAKFRTQIQEEQLKRKVLEESCKELKHEMFLLRDKEATWMENNSALQFKINQQESRLRSLDDEQSASVRERMYREGANQKLTEDLLQAQQEKEELHKAYDNISKQLDECIRKYNEKQLRYKAKLDRAKEVHIHEVNQHNLRIKQLEMEITLIRSQTEKEQQWISKVITENEHLNEEKRHLLQKIQEHETTERNHKWELLSAQNRAHMLDEENQHLQESLLKLYNQVGSLDRVLRKIQALNVEEITNIIPSEIHIPQLQNKSIPIAGVFSSSGTLKDTSSTQLQEPADSIQSLSVSISHTSDIGYLNVSSPGAEPTSAEQTQSLELSIEKVHI
ncbi:hypothetical protein GDO86_012613 [Hymenochirus boettgeri]|uniref:Coiled-coil domain-containing protein 30 n=1 Tax=Hymenochirus boettgeri TaxID=247094 RepID=A0A8T2ITG6_9PIPI|nr:hypothetical protein GDO86_012613 [Hymenochirus boettgeri]